MEIVKLGLRSSMSSSKLLVTPRSQFPDVSEQSEQRSSWLDGFSSGSLVLDIRDAEAT